MYRSGKIGIFISHLMGFYQKNVCQGIIDRALEYGYTPEIFTTLDGENLGEYGIGEESILKIPDYASYDGMIFASETYPLPELKEQILTALKDKCTCPIVEITYRNPHFPSVTLENNQTTEQLTVHLAKVHQAKRICYLGCRPEQYISDIRKDFYLRGIRNAGLAAGPNDIYMSDYTGESAAAALSYFRSSGSLPDAVVCYNDRLALLFYEEVQKAGFRIPEEIAITGCDCTPEGGNISPALTTVTFPVYELGACAFLKLLAMIRGETVPAVTGVPAETVIRSSCGCHHLNAPDPVYFQHSKNSRIEALETSILSSMRMSAALQRTTGLDEGLLLLENFIPEIEHCSEFYLCLYADWDRVPSHIRQITENVEPDEAISTTDEVLLKFGIRNKKRLPECSFRRPALLPEHIYRKSSAAYIYTPLFFEDREFGYAALSYENNEVAYHFQLVLWFMNINQMLQNICEARYTSLLVHRLEEMYTKDPLTGLLNEQGFYREAAALAEKYNTPADITCHCFYLTGLSAVRKTYGSSEADLAIQVLGQALNSIAGTDGICARFGGRRFFLLSFGKNGTDTDAVPAERILKYLSNYTKLHRKDYQLKVACGKSAGNTKDGIHGELFKRLAAEAEEMMYAGRKA